MLVETTTKWDARFFAMCALVASWSEDRSRKVGAVIVGPANEIRATGYNGLPRRVDASIAARHSREGGTKYLWFEHAERNAIYNLTRCGISAENSRIYVNSFPCADCTRGIIQSGIVELCTYGYDPSDATFGDHFVAAEEMIAEAGIKLRLFDRSDAQIRDAIEAFRHSS